MSSSITTAALSDALPSTVPKLDASGSNWAIFVFRFEDAVEAKGFWGHFDGTVSRPIAVNPAAPTATETAAIAQWDKDERSAKSLLTQKLPDSTVVMVHGKVTVRERWEAVVREFSKKSAYAQADMRAKFMAMRCPDKGNPREFLEGLRVKKEELAQAGVVIDEKDYFSIIIASLPMALSNFASNQLAAAQFSSRKMMPSDLLSMLLEESDRQQAQYQRRRGSGKGKDEVDEALEVGQDSRGRKRYSELICWNCDEVGHISRHCKKPKKPKGGNSGGKQAEEVTGNANTAVGSYCDNEEEGAWAAIEVEVEEPDWFELAIKEMEMAKKQAAIKESPTRDWFYEVAEGESESDDEEANSKDAGVEGIGKDASGGAFVKAETVVLGNGAYEGTNPADSPVTSHIWLCDTSEGADQSSDTLLGHGLMEAQVALVVSREGEHGGGGTTCGESSAIAADLDLCGNPWIDDATMEWRNHANALRIPEEVHPLENHKGGEVDPDAPMCEGCYAEDNPATVEYLSACRFEGEDMCRCETADLPTPCHVPPDCEDSLVAEIPPTTNEFQVAKKLPNNDLPDSVVSEKDSSVVVFEEKEEKLNETEDLLVTSASSPSSVEIPVVKPFDPPDRAFQTIYGCAESLSNVANLSVGREKFFERVETCHYASTTHNVPKNLLVGCAIPSEYPKTSYNASTTHIGWLDEVIHLERPPGCVFEGSWLAYWLLIELLIAYRAYHVAWLTCHFRLDEDCVDLKGVTTGLVSI